MFEKLKELDRRLSMTVEERTAEERTRAPREEVTDGHVATVFNGDSPALAVAGGLTVVKGSTADYPSSGVNIARRSTP